MRRALIVGTAVLVCLAVGGIVQARSDRLWFGGDLGFSFGDVDTINVAPRVGFSLTDRVSAGVGLSYRYRKDGRFADELSTKDYGASVFTRVDLSGQLFAHAEYEYLSYEYVRADLTKDRDEFASVLAGPGYSRSLGGRASLYLLALYNFSYDRGDLRSPYDDPWTYRVGVTVGF